LYRCNEVVVPRPAADAAAAMAWIVEEFLGKDPRSDWAPAARGPDWAPPGRVEALNDAHWSALCV
jgi:hypothetical protein